MISAVTNGLTTAIGWVGDVVTALMSGGLSELLPLFGIGIGVSAFFMAMKAIRGVTWGA